MTSNSKAVAEICQFVREYVANLLGVSTDEVSLDAQLNDTGLTSSAIVSLVGDLEEMLDMEISPSLLYEAGSIQGAVERLVQLSSAGGLAVTP
jgi:acyl carrier protein